MHEEGEKEQRPLLRTAREFRKELGTRCGVPSISIFGYGIKTVTRVKVKRGGAFGGRSGHRPPFRSQVLNSLSVPTANHRNPTRVDPRPTPRGEV